MIDILLINPQPVVMKDLFAENLMYANPPLGLGRVWELCGEDTVSDNDTSGMAARSEKMV